MADAAVFLDGRGDDRALRMSWHTVSDSGADIVVLSMWRENVCVGTFRLSADEVPAMIAFLSSGLAATYPRVHPGERDSRPA